MPKMTKGRLLIRFRRRLPEHRWRRDTNWPRQPGRRPGGAARRAKRLRGPRSSARREQIGPLAIATNAAQGLRERVPQPTAAEREVADLLPIGADHETGPRGARAGPACGFTPSRSTEAPLYTPGVARDHRYRHPRPAATTSAARACSTWGPSTASMPSSPRLGARARGRGRQRAIPRLGARSRGASSSRAARASEAIAELLDSRVEYRRLDAFDLDQLDERFDLSSASGSCTGSRARSACSRCCAAGSRRRRLRAPGDLRGRQSVSWSTRRRCTSARRARSTPATTIVYWGFTGESLARLARHAGFAGWRSSTRR